MYTLILDKYSKQDLIEIQHKLNRWKWDNRLGEKPKDWDDMPDYIVNNPYNFPTKYEFMKPITNYIKQKINEKESLKYHHLNFCNMNRLQHEICWIKNQLSKFFKVGFYGRKGQENIRNILQQLVDRDTQEWIHKTYYND